MKYYGCFAINADIVQFLNNMTEPKTLLVFEWNNYVNHIKDTPVFSMKYGFSKDITFLDTISYDMTTGFLGKRECLKM